MLDNPSKIDSTRMENYMKSKFKLVRLEPEDDKRLKTTASRLGLSAADILRRSWRIAAPKFETIPAPGVRIKNDGS